MRYSKSRANLFYLVFLELVHFEFYSFRNGQHWTSNIGSLQKLKKPPIIYFRFLIFKLQSWWHKSHNFHFFIQTLLLKIFIHSSWEMIFIGELQLENNFHLERWEWKQVNPGIDQLISFSQNITRFIRVREKHLLINILIPHLFHRLHRIIFQMNY